MGTIFIRISNQKKRLPVGIRAIKQVPLEITVKNKVPSENIHIGSLFLTNISRGT
jgi:hypothetical protein